MPVFRLVALAAITVAIFAAAPIQAQPLAPVQAFAHPPQLASADLSPSGEFIVFSFQRDGQDMIAVAPARPGPDMAITTRSIHPAEILRWIAWANDDRVLYATSRVHTAETRHGEALYTSTRLYSADPGLAEVIELRTEPDNRPTWRTPPPQFFDRITDFLAEDDNHILQTLNWRDQEVFDLYRTDVTNGEIELVAAGIEGTQHFTVDRQARPRIMSGERMRHGEAQPFLMIRQSADGPWLDASDLLSEEHDFIPLGFAEDPGILYVASGHDGDTLGLFTFDVARMEFGPLIFRHPSVDVGSLVYTADRRRVVGVTYTLDSRETYYFDDAYRQSDERLAQRLDRETVRTTSIAQAQGRSLIQASSADNPGSLYLYEADSDALTEIGEFRPGLAGVAMGSVRSVSLTARDGLVLPSYVTLPPDSEPGRAIPFIILVHGGPAARDFQRFDDWVQFLASRGYGVLQVNYRGSRGFGHSFQEAGDGEWGRGMQDDVDDAARWLVEQNYARSGQIAVMGASYGGYAALMAASRNNGLYAAAISINGITDLNAMIANSRRYIGLERRLREMLDGVDLDAMSPAQHTRSMEIPLFIAHASHDRTVPFDQFERIIRRLPRARAGDRFVELPFDSHNIDRYQNRLFLLASLEAFLFENMPSERLAAAWAAEE